MGSVWLGLTTTGSGDPGSPSSLRISETVFQLLVMFWTDLSTDGVLVLGQTQTSFRSAEQELAIIAILQGKSPLAVILPTRGGKSLLFIVPACLTNPSVTIVVVPFQALLNNLSDQLEKAGIKHINREAVK
jgi:hypothetical protein